MFSLSKRLLMFVVALLSLGMPSVVQAQCLEELNQVPECSGPSIPAAGNWRIVTVGTSLVPDAVALQLAASDAFVSTFGDSQVAQLELRCQNNNTSLTLHFPDTFMSEFDDGGIVETNIDGGLVLPRSMSVVWGNTALSITEGARAVPVIKGLLDAAELTVRATPYRGSTIEAVFAVGGLSEAIAPLRAACNW